jgi:hypothetical protein
MFNSLLQEIIDAGQISTIKLNMSDWHCGSSCCACGDVAVARSKSLDVAVARSKSLELLKRSAYVFSRELRAACSEVFQNITLAVSVYGQSYNSRYYQAVRSGLLTYEELKHPHLNTDHDDRKILNEYIRIVMTKVDEELAKS